MTISARGKSMTSVADTVETTVWRDSRAVTLLMAATLTVMANATISRRFLLIAGILLFVVSGSAGLYLPDLPTIFMSRIVLGVAVAFIMTAQTALIGDYFSGETRTALTGLQISARNFGGLVFILLAGSVAAISPRLAFGVYGLAILVLPLTWMAIVEPHRTSAKQQSGP
jgi:MFS family permease